MSDSLFAGERSPSVAHLYPVWVGGRAGYKFDVHFDEEVIVSRSLDAEHDAARALLKRGISGILTILDGKTHKPRTLIDIVKAARWSLTEESRDGFRLRKWRENPDSNTRTAERASGDVATLDRLSAPGIAA